MKILVVGGAGYIGCHMVDVLLAQQHDVVVLDNLSSGHDDFVAQAKLIKGDLGDNLLLEKLFSENKFDAVMHFAAFIQVGESVIDPQKYYENNVTKTLTLLNAMHNHQITNFVFSSTAAVYGDPLNIPIDENHPKNPVNPYGRCKWMIEQILADYNKAYGLCSVSLRYFNAAGADLKTRFGECHDPETHLIPLLLEVANGRRECITLFGDDYPTPDRTCIRDYIHVTDIAGAHLLALEKLVKGDVIAQAYNLGNGKGFSVKEVIAATEKVTGKKITIKIAPRRDGDPPQLIADSCKAKQELGWQPQYSDLNTIIDSAWRWELQRYPNQQHQTIAKDLI